MVKVTSSTAFLALVLSISFTGLLWNARALSSRQVAAVVTDRDGQAPEPALPPLYEEYYDFERSLPQLDPSLPPPEGDTGRYFFPANRVWGE